MPLAPGVCGRMSADHRACSLPPRPVADSAPDHDRCQDSRDRHQQPQKPLEYESALASIASAVMYLSHAIVSVVDAQKFVAT